MQRQLRTDVSRGYDALAYDAEAYDGILEGAGHGSGTRLIAEMERRQREPLQVPVAAQSGARFGNSGVPNAPQFSQVPTAPEVGLRFGNGNVPSAPQRGWP